MRSSRSAKSSTPCLSSVRPVFVQRDGEQPPHAAREHEVDVALERLDRRLHVRAEAGHDHLVPLVVGGRAEVAPCVWPAACAARRSASARDPTGDRAGLAVAPAAAAASAISSRISRASRSKPGHVGTRSRSNAWTTRPSPPEIDDIAPRSACSQPVAGRVDRHLAAAQESVERVARDQPAIEQRRQRLAQPRLAELGEQQRHSGSSSASRGRSPARGRATLRRSAASRFRRRDRSRDRRRPRAETRAAATGRTRRWC